MSVSAPLWTGTVFIPASLILVRYPSGQLAGAWPRRFERAVLIGFPILWIGYATSAESVTDEVAGHLPPVLLPEPVSGTLMAVGLLLVVGGTVAIVVDAFRRVFRGDRAERPALLLLLVTFQLGTVAFDDRRVGLVAVAVLATTSDFFVYSRSARPEMLYALFCTLQMLGLMIAVRNAERGFSSARGAALAWGATVAAILAKGPQHPVFFLLGTSLALVLRQPRLSPGKW